MRIAILDDYQGLALSLANWSSLGCDIEVFRENLTVEEAGRRLQRFDVVCLMRERMAFPSSLIEALPALKLITTTGRRTPSLAIATARARGITVCYSTGGPDGQWSTAELAWGLILASARQIPQEDAALRNGAWQASAGLGLRGKALGLIGLGRIGQQMASYAHAFGMTPLAWSPNLTTERAAAHRVERVDKPDLFRRAEVVSLHMVLSERSRHIVGAAEIGAMRDRAILVNTSRAGLIEERALFDALAANRIRAALDVFPDEPLPVDSPYHALPNTILTPHLGYVTTETMTDFHRGTVEVVRAFIDGTPIRQIMD
jgi:phosphoglycerate dehydrogenase-like enzyme